MCLLWLPYPLMLVNRAICGFLGSNSAILRSSAVQHYIPERLRSRVNALNSVLLTTVASVFFPADGFSGGSARLSLVRYVRRRCHPAGLSFSHRRQAAGCSKGVRGGLSPSRARTLCSICFRLMDRYFKGTVCSTVPFRIRFYTNWRRLRSASACSSSLPYHMMPGNLR